MYIEQAKYQKNNLVLYLVFILGFLGLIVFNFISTLNINTDDLIDQMIEQVGVNTTFVLMVLPLSALLLGLFFWVKFLHRQSIRSFTTARIKVDWSRIFFSFFLWGSVSVLMTLIAYWTSPEDFIFNFQLKPFLIFLVLALVLIPMQTSFEEYFFRAYMMQGLGIFTKSRLIPFITSSVLFGLMHIANPEVEKMGMVIMIFYIGTGFFLGLITLMDEGLELALGFHAANNLIGALLVTSDWTAFQTNSILKDVSEPTAGYDVLIPVFIFFPILIALFAKKYNWSGWKDKLTGKVMVE